jgi:hypothetical protein
MAKKQVGSKPKARSALGLQALHDAYALGWKDRGEIERAK